MEVNDLEILPIDVMIHLNPLNPLEHLEHKFYWNCYNNNDFFHHFYPL